MSEPAQLESRLRRDISRIGFAAMTLNGVIGAGIFGLPAVVAARAGAFSPWMFVLGALLTLTVVLSFARASSLVRETGGVIVYASHAFGPFIGFQTGWLAWLSRIASMAANTNLLVTYAAWFWPALGDQPWRSVALTVVIGSLTWLNVVGVRNSIAAVYAFTVLKLLPLSLLVLFGLGQLEAEQLFRSELPPLGSFGETILVLLYAYVGFEGTVVNAGEGRRPRRDLPWALLQTTLLIALTYFFIQAVSVAVLPDLATSQTALADVAAALFGPLGAALLTLGAVFSIGGNLMTSLLSAPRMTWALSRDGSMPQWFAAVHPRHQTPHHSILFYGCISLVLALSGSFVWLAAMSTAVRLAAYVICIAALPKLERRVPVEEQTFRLPGGRLIPLLALLLCLWLMSHASASAWGVMAVFMAAGSLLYAMARKKRAS